MEENDPKNFALDYDCYWLSTEAFAVRYAIAAYFLRDCETIIEIGGYTLCIGDFIDDPKKTIVVVGPKTLPKYTVGHRRHYIVPFQEWNGRPEQFENYGFMILGLGISPLPSFRGNAVDAMEVHHWERLAEFVNRSKRSIIESPTDYWYSNHQLGILESLMKKRKVKELALEISSVIPRESVPPRFRAIRIYE